MNFLNSKEMEVGAKGFVTLVSITVPLAITYRLFHDLAVAVPTAVVLWLAIAALWRLAWRPWERHEAKEFASAVERQRVKNEARRAADAALQEPGGKS